MRKHFVIIGLIIWDNKNNNSCNWTRRKGHFLTKGHELKMGKIMKTNYYSKSLCDANDDEEQQFQV